jgi:hypothetical protein
MSGKFIVITSINPPSEGIARFRDWDGWEVIVVGDKKTPTGWECDGVTCLGLEEQRKLFPGLAAAIPENTYRRKMIGYAYAIKNGATAIFESDDDNIPYSDAADIVDAELFWDRKDGERRGTSNAFLNVYELFGARNCWPRGYPLEHVRDFTIEAREGRDTNPWAIMQFLCDEDPDVDAVYRMTRGRPVYFARNRKFILDAGTSCPFNSQATLWTPESFPLMFLPGGVTDRVTDILRSYIATRCLWHAGMAVAYASPIVYQKRNHHNLLNDFVQEMDLYFHSAEWFWALSLMEMKAKDMAGRYRECIERLGLRTDFLLENTAGYGLFLKAAGLE